ncbi:MAG: hypothetical protein RLZZ306_1589 [Bacteroidota bacterium]|jgi:hypothetical protein
MITTVVGKTFLDAYNTKYSTNKSPKEFFEQVYFEFFYNHSKYMQWVTNSPFVQMKAGQKPHLLTVDERKEKLGNLFEKAENEEPDGSFALGFPASELKEYASTSGLVSNVLIPTTSEDIYLSWIGSGLGIGVAGGFSILFNDAAITLQIFDGWKFYRKYLEDESLDKLRGNQINTWNGQWLTYSFDKRIGRFKPDFDFIDLANRKIFDVSSTLVQVNTVNWCELFFSLSQFYPNGELLGYVYGFGQTNKTIGFIPFYLKSCSKINQVYSKLYGNKNINPNDFESLFGMDIKRACELGSIGLQALRPGGLTKYMKEDKNITFKKEEDIFNYYAYKTWLIAMISKNKEEITDYTLELAETFLEYKIQGTKNDRKTLLEKMFSVSGKKKLFLPFLDEMINGFDNEALIKLRNFRNEIHLMTNEEFEYFYILLKFDYAFVEKKS